MKFSEVLATVIDLSRKIRAYWETELPKRLRDYPIISPGEDVGPPPPEKAVLREFLSHLSPEIVYKMHLLKCLGTRDFSTADLAVQFEDMKIRFGKPDLARLQLLEKIPLGDYLADGLAALKQSKIDPDKLFVKAAKARK